MEKLMDSVSHIVTNTEYRSKCIRTRTQMSDLTQKLHGVSLFLQRISSWISRTEDLNLSSLYLHALPLALGLCQDTVYADTSSRGNRFQELITQFIYIHNDLNIINCRTVIQGDKIHLFATTAGANPSFHVHGSTESFAFQHVYNFCSFNCFHLYRFFLFESSHPKSVHFPFI